MCMCVYVEVTSKTIDYSKNTNVTRGFIVYMNKMYEQTTTEVGSRINWRNLATNFLFVK